MSNNFILQCQEFMYLYMYELEKKLKSNIKQLENLSFHADEANTDRPLKEFMKDFIQNKCNRIPPDTLNKHMQVTLGNQKRVLLYRDYQAFHIKKVYLPDELTEELKQYVALSKDFMTLSKDSVYTNPDLLLEITNGISNHYIPVELKSTKNDSIPGSSIQQIKPNEWVIFVKHGKNHTDVVTGQYLNSINRKLQFPDRSPRPEVSFKELKDWNKANRYEKNSKVVYNMNKDEINQKTLLLTNWQDYLADRWVHVVFTNTTKKNEPWFNNNLRKFILKFIDKYEKLTASEKKQYKKMVQSLIKE